MKGGNVVERTPGTIKLDSNNPTDRSFSIEKEGYQSESVSLNTSTDSGIIFWDVILGGWPLLVDAATSNLDRFDKTSYSFVLRPSESKGSETSSDSEDSETSNSVFAEEDEENNGEEETDENKEENQKESSSEFSVTIKNSSYGFFEDTITVLESIKDVSIIEKVYENGESKYEVDSDIPSTDLVSKITNRTEEGITVEKISEKELVFDIEK
jgi:hypothetical protein